MVLAKGFLGIVCSNTGLMLIGWLTLGFLGLPLLDRTRDRGMLKLVSTLIKLMLMCNGGLILLKLL